MMKGKILVDSGRGGRVLCTGEREADPHSPVLWIGRALSERLAEMGYEPLFSEDVPELNCRAPENGRPALCASVARRWGADCVLRLCVKEAELPMIGQAGATVHRGDRRSKELAEMILRRLDLESELNACELHTASCMVLLRRTPCPCVILVLRLPFLQMEQFCDADASLYANSIANGAHAWFSSRE